MLQFSDLKIAVIGLGYVGLSLAVEFGKKVPVVGLDIYDPWVNSEEIELEYGFEPISYLENRVYDTIILSLAHDQFKQMSAQNYFDSAKSDKYVLYGLKYILNSAELSIRI